MNLQLQRAYWSLEKRLAPGLKSAQAIYAEVLDRYVDADTRWLDIGCGHQIFEPWIKGEEALVRRASLVVGADPDFSSVRRHRSIQKRIVASTLPLRSGSFSLITANMVLEHVVDPNAFFADARRLLCPGGHLIVHTPNARHWQVWASRILPSQLRHKLVQLADGRDQDDVYPTYYRANTPTELTRTALDSGLRIETMMLCDTSTPSRLMLGPLVVVDLLIVRIHRREEFAGLRSNMIAVFQAGS
ncbi:MAG: Methyltransferase type 11 [Gemmatimonadetes bacterium]|nr:Methyltransferase type 11 [Gemmatimonadota bacterium]